jgi:hypothetical protein
MTINDIINQLLTALSFLPPLPHSSPSKPIELFTAYAEAKIFSLLDKMKQDERAEATAKEEKAEDPEEIFQKNIAAIIDLQSELFSIMKQSDHIPPHAPHSRLTALLLTLAQALESVAVKSQYELLLPGVTVIDYEASATSLKDHDLQLTDFVLSDDGDAIIEVFSSLAFAEEDGVLKHTRLFDEQPRALSEAEASRVIHHSKDAETYWKAIQEVINIVVRGESFGAALRRLCDSLRQGGAHGSKGGTELKAGPDADMGISLFFDWYNNVLTSEEQNTLADYGNDYKTLDELLGRLANPSAEKYQDTRYCVEIIASMIEDILHQKPHLYNDYPANSRPPMLLLAQLQKGLAEARESLKKKMKNAHNYHVTSTYGPEAESQFSTRVQQLHDLQTYTNDFPMRKSAAADEEQNSGRQHLISNDAEMLAILEALNTGMLEEIGPQDGSAAQLERDMFFASQPRHSAQSASREGQMFFASPPRHLDRLLDEV